MTKREWINKTVRTLEKLPEKKIQEVSDFADYLLKKYDEQILNKGIENLVSGSNSFRFLYEEEDLYDESDLKETY